MTLPARLNAKANWEGVTVWQQKTTAAPKQVEPPARQDKSSGSPIILLVPCALSCCIVVGTGRALDVLCR